VKRKRFYKKNLKFLNVRALIFLFNNNKNIFSNRTRRSSTSALKGNKLIRESNNQTKASSAIKPPWEV
jgi:hypothetical protein